MLPCPIDGKDNIILRLGTSQDLQIYHDGNHSYLNHTGTGHLYMYGNGVNDIYIRAKSDENSIIAKTNGAVELYYDSVEKFRTNPGGIKVSGNIACDGDNQKLILGAGDDLQIYHDGTTNIISGLYHPIEIRHGAEVHINCIDDGAVQLYHNNSLRFQTTSDGFQAQSNTTEAVFTIRSTAQDGAPTLQFLSDDYDDNADAWRLRADGGGTAFAIQNRASGSWEKNIECNEDGNVELYYDNSKKLETISPGVNVTGSIRINGTGDNWADSNGGIKITGNTSGSRGSISMYYDTNVLEIGVGVTQKNRIELHAHNGDNAIKYFVGNAQRGSWSSAGLCFGTDTATANALDDYEEGTWTPTTGNWTVSENTTNTGKYTKIGNFVQLSWNMSLTVVNGGYTGSGSGAYIGGLPFSVADCAVATFSNSTLWTSTLDSIDNIGGSLYFRPSRFSNSGIATDSMFNSSGVVKLTVNYRTS